jgi:hypothetical protein
VVLPGESLEGFQALFTQHLERFGPVDGVEEGMIEEMAAAYWRMRRAWAMETELLTQDLDSQPGGSGRSRITASFRQLASSPELALLHRYETRLHMMYQRAFHNILLLRTVANPTAGQVLDLPTPTGIRPADSAVRRSPWSTAFRPAPGAPRHTKRTVRIYLTTPTIPAIVKAWQPTPPPFKKR